MIELALTKRLHTADGNMDLRINLQVPPGECVTLYGMSGAGKTSILRMLAGFMKPDAGYIKSDGVAWFDAERNINLEPQKRRIGFVFQDYALFPNMNVQENIAFALAKNEPGNIVQELLELTGLGMLAKRKIGTLSGGQKQRVALARAIANRPSLLLLDEPLSAIDNFMRTQLQVTLLEVHRRFGLTTILVSHDMDEILRLSGRIIHLEHGQVQHDTTPSLFFMRQSKTEELSGSVVSVAEQYNNSVVVVLLDNRMITVQRTQPDINLQVGEKVVIHYQNDIPIIRKL